MSLRTVHRLATAAAVLALAGVAFVAWSSVDPSPLAVVVAMTVGQSVGTASLILLVAAIVIDLKRAGVLSPMRPRRTSNDGPHPRSSNVRG